MISYSGLLQKLNEKGLTKTALAKELGISSRTVAKIGRREKIADYVLEKMAAFFSCSTDELCRAISDNSLLQMLRDEKDIRMPGGLYHELQVRMTYNSNHIEGSKLSEDQTRLIFETNTIDIGEGIPVDDIIETVNHFRAIDFCIDMAEEPLTEDIIKELHRILKQSTKDSTLAWFAVGDYKKRANMVGGRETAKPKEVAPRIKALLAEYEAKTAVTINDIIGFHYAFERIHPFQDAHVIIGTRLEKPSKINGFALLSPNFFMPERGERNHHTSTYIAGQQYESLIAIKATIPSFGDGFEGPKSL